MRLNDLAVRCAISHKLDTTYALNSSNGSFGDFAGNIEGGAVPLRYTSVYLVTSETAREREVFLSTQT